MGLLRVLPLLGIIAATSWWSAIASDGEGERSDAQWWNWQGAIHCEPPAGVYSPTTIEEVQAIVRNHHHVRPNGGGHSFNDFVCSKDAMISMLKMNKVLNVDTVGMTVTVQGGVIIEDLLHHLRQMNLTINTSPFCITQTVAGAIATGTHGSSLTQGSMSEITTSIKMVMADGSIRIFTNEDGKYMDAARISVGLMGVIVELTMKIMPDKMVRRGFRYINEQELVRQIREIAANPQDHDEETFFWFPALYWVGHLTYKETHDRPNRLYQSSLNATYNWLYERKFLDAFYIPANWTHGPQFAGTFALPILYSLSMTPGVFPLSIARAQRYAVTMAVEKKAWGRYDQIEFSIPLHMAADCFHGLFELFDRDWNSRNTIFQGSIMRFMSKETSLLSNTFDGPRMFINLDNYTPYRDNMCWENVVRHFMGSRCKSRIHFGKADANNNNVRNGSWVPQSPDTMFNVAREWGDRWWTFQDILNEVDPNGKFSDPRGILRPGPLSGRRW